MLQALLVCLHQRLSQGSERTGQSLGHQRRSIAGFCACPIFHFILLSSSDSLGRTNFFNSCRLATTIKKKSRTAPVTEESIVVDTVAIPVDMGTVSVAMAVDMVAVEVMTCTNSNGIPHISRHSMEAMETKSKHHKATLEIIVIIIGVTVTVSNNSQVVGEI